MKCPTPCIQCGRLIELHRLLHPTNCRQCRNDGTCGNLVCPQCRVRNERARHRSKQKERR